MTSTSRLESPEPPEPRRWRWLPFGDRSRARRLAKVLAWLAGIALVLVILDLLGVHVRGWLSDLWDALSGVGLGYLLAGWTLQTLQTTLTALAWYFILRAAYPSGRVAYLQVLAAYAVGPALNGVLPANLGTVVMSPPGFRGARVGWRFGFSAAAADVGRLMARGGRRPSIRGTPRSGV